MAEEDDSLERTERELTKQREAHKDKEREKLEEITK